MKVPPFLKEHKKPSIPPVLTLIGVLLAVSSLSNRAYVGRVPSFCTDKISAFELQRSGKDHPFLMQLLQ